MLSRLFPGAVERFEDDYDTAPLRERSYQRSRGHLRRHPATRRTRWLWLVPLAAGLLTVLLVTPPGVQHAPAPASQHPAPRAGAAAEIAGDACPSVAQLPAWLACLWHTGQEAARGGRSTTTTTRPRGHAMAPSPTRPLGSKWG